MSWVAADANRAGERGGEREQDENRIYTIDK